MQQHSKYDQYLLLLEFRDVNPVEAEKIAEKCFHAQSWLVKDLADAEYKELILTDNVDMVESELMVTVPTEYKNAETRKAFVHTRPTRREAYERHAGAKVSVDYLKRLLKLFEGAQIYYANKAKR